MEKLMEMKMSRDMCSSHINVVNSISNDRFCAMVPIVFADFSTAPLMVAIISVTMPMNEIMH